MAFCQNCGNEIKQGETFCTVCGAPATNATAYSNQTNQNNQSAYAPTQNYTQTYNQPANNSNYIPEEYKPMSAWAYFGYSILFSIPLVGLIINLVLCFSKTNINKRNYARSFWCWYIIVIIAIVIATISGVSILSML